MCPELHGAGMDSSSQVSDLTSCIAACSSSVLMALMAFLNAWLWSPDVKEKYGSSPHVEKDVQSPSG